MDALRVAEVARSLGTEFRSVVPCAGGNSSENFQAGSVDGRTFFVKFAPAQTVRRLLELHAGFRCPLVPNPVASGADWIAFPWRQGTLVHPVDMTREHLLGVIRAVADFHRASGGRRHGDLHYRNLLFEGAEVSTICDLECMREGTATDDLLRLFVHALERTRFWRWRRLAAINRNFVACVKLSGYPQTDWIASIDRYEQHKLERRLKKKARWMAWIESRLRGGLYRSLRRHVASAQ